MGEVIDLKPAANPDVVLEKAKGAYEELLIIGLGKENLLDIRGTMGMDKPLMLLLIEQFKFNLLAGYYDEDGE